MAELRYVGQPAAEEVYPANGDNFFREEIVQILGQPVEELTYTDDLNQGFLESITISNARGDKLVCSPHELKSWSYPERHADGD